MFGLLGSVFEYTSSVISGKNAWILGAFSSVVSISNVVSFFIPLKIILLLDSPSSFDKFDFDILTTDQLVYFVVFVFLMAVLVSIFGRIFVNREIEKHKEKFYKNAVTLYGSTISIATIFVVVLYLEYILAGFLLACFLGFLFYAEKLAKNGAKYHEYSTAFQTMSDGGFYLTFVLILALYFAGFEMILIQVLLGFMLSRVYFRNLNHFSTQLITIHRELAKR